MAAISNNYIARAIYEELRGKSDQDLPQAMSKVVRFLDKKRLLSRAPEILERLDKIINEGEGMIRARVYAAKKLTEPQKEEISKALSAHYGKKILIEEKTDEGLLGGWRVEVNDEVIDQSLQGKIRKLQAHLTKTI